MAGFLNNWILRMGYPILQSGGVGDVCLYLRPGWLRWFFMGGKLRISIYPYIEFQWSLGFICFRWWFFLQILSWDWSSLYVWISPPPFGRTLWVVHPFPSTGFESQNPRSGPEPSITNHLKPHPLPCLLAFNRAYRPTGRHLPVLSIGWQRMNIFLWGTAELAFRKWWWCWKDDGYIWAMKKTLVV